MPTFAPDTAYYLNRQIPAVALIGKGVRFPAGTWTRVADARAVPWLVEQQIGTTFPDLKGAVMSFVVLTNEHEVQEFERSLPP